MGAATGSCCVAVESLFDLSCGGILAVMANSFLSKINPFRKWRPTLWAGFIPNGMGQIKPNHYLDMVRVLWQNKDQLPFAWRILSRGVCDGCALGTSGLKDYTLDGVHLCTVRLQLLRLNTMPGLAVESLTDVSALEKKNSRELRDLGRLPRLSRSARG